MNELEVIEEWLKQHEADNPLISYRGGEFIAETITLLIGYSEFRGAKGSTIFEAVSNWKQKHEGEKE